MTFLVNCVMSNWSSYGTCTVTCGGGTQTRTRTITQEAQHGGTACEALSESQNCSPDPCPGKYTLKFCHYKIRPLGFSLVALY